MYAGDITINGRKIGVISWSTSDEANDVLIMGESLSGHPPGFEPEGPKTHSGGGGQLHGAPKRSRQHIETPEEHKHNSIRYGHHVRHEDIPRASSGNPFDRSRFDKELKEKPWLKEKLAHISVGENSDKDANLGVIEETMNRAIVRGTSLEAQAKRHRKSGVDENGYYAGYAKNITPDERAMFNRNLEEALGHTGKGQSNITNYATDNASSWLADKQTRTGAFVHHKEIAGEHFFSPGSAEPVFRDRWNKLHTQAVEFEKGKGNPQEPSPTAPSAGNGLKGGDVSAFIMHHTGGRGTPEGVRDTLRHRGLGVEYIMDREGNITVAGGRGSSHIKPGWGAGSGLNNQNTVGMEVIAKNDRDVTPAQIAAAKAFVEKNYPNTPVYGHGEVNPGHKEADEGMSIVKAIRNSRATADKHQPKNDPLSSVVVTEEDKNE